MTEVSCDVIECRKNVSCKCTATIIELETVPYEGLLCRTEEDN